MSIQKQKNISILLDLDSLPNVESVCPTAIVTRRLCCVALWYPLLLEAFGGPETVELDEISFISKQLAYVIV